MKNAFLSLRIPTALIVAFLSIQAAHGAVTTWNVTGGNWSLGLNWDTLAAPGIADDARFGNVGAGTPTTMDISRTINSLGYAQDNQALHTTVISSGQTLTINRTTAGDVLNVGSASAAITPSTQTPVSFQGTGATLSLSGTGDLVVRQGNSTAGSHMATLDLSALDNLTATIGRLLVGQATAGNAVNRPSGTLIFAKTNHITLSGASPQVMLQDSGSNANGGTASVMSFGQETHLFGDVMRLGGQKGNANLSFNSAFNSPSLEIKGTDGVSRVSTIDFGYNGAANSGNNTICVADFSAGTVDLSANLVNIAQGNPGPLTGTCTGTLTVGAGVIDVNTLEIGYGNATGANGAATATVNINNNSLFTTGAVLRVNTTMRLARTNGGSGVINGTLNINGGVVTANSIVSGGGVSTITLTSGSTLAISNSAGTLAAPIRVLSLSDAALIVPALNAGSVTVSNLTVGGAQNVITVSAIPPISSYPATFPLITYQTGAGGNFVLGPLPPSYIGSLVDLTNGVVALRLTAGPIVDLSLRWTGANNNTWDSTTFNWIYQGNPSNFFSGATALFNDTAAQSTVSLAEALSPGSVIVSNNVLSYTFTGSGNIAGAASLTKNGSGSLFIVNTGVDNFVNVSINNGTLQLGTNGPDGSISAVNITNNGAFIVNRSGSLTLSSAIAGSGSLTKTGDGALVLSGANTYSGPTFLTGGTLQLDESSSGNGRVVSSAGTVLAGSGTINGAVTNGGQLNPGPINGPGTFKAHGGLTLTSGSTARFDLSATDPSNLAVNDSVEVFGNLALNNNVISVNFSGTPQTGASYLLFTYSGALSGTFNPVVVGSHFAMALDTSVPGSVFLNVTGNSGLDLKWNSVSDTAWDATSINWLNLNNSSPTAFFSGDTALLDDTAGITTGITIAAGISVFPSIITNNSANNSFTISGAGKISGTASIVKMNSSTLAIGTANNFSGTVDVQAGVLRTDNDTALGTIAGGTTIEPGATLDVNGHNLGGEPVTVSGSGVFAGGAIVNSGGAQAQAFRQIVLAGNTTFGGVGLWGINNSGGAASLSTGGNPFNLTKVGANQVSLAQLTTVDGALADIDIQEGILEFSGLTPNMGDPAHTNSVQAGATVSFANGAVAWNKQFLFNGDGLTATVNVGTGGNPELAGPVEIHGDCLLNVGGTALTISGVISGDGGLIKSGASPLILTSSNFFAGDTSLNTGVMRLNGAGSLSGSSNITLALGTTLSLTGRVDTALNLGAGQTLKGNGTVNGILHAGIGSTVSPGVDGVGSLIVSNAVTLSGTTTMNLDEAGGTNDVLRSNSSITYGGTLNLVNLGGPLSGNASFKLFSASSYPGSFTSIVPATPGPNQTWDTSALGTSGILKVSSGAQPRFGTIVVSGANVVITGSNGVALTMYYVLASTNVALPRTNWTRIATNTFDLNGNFTFTTPINPAIPTRFFLIELP